MKIIKPNNHYHILSEEKCTKENIKPGDYLFNGHYISNDIGQLSKHVCYKIIATTANIPGIIHLTEEQLSQYLQEQSV